MKKGVLLLALLLACVLSFSCSEKDNNTKVSTNVKVKTNVKVLSNVKVDTKIVIPSHKEEEQKFKSFIDDNNGYYYSDKSKSVIKLTSDSDKDTHPIIKIAKVVNYDLSSNVIYFGKEHKIDVFDYKGLKIDFDKVFSVKDKKIETFNYKGESYKPLSLSKDTNKDPLYNLLDKLFS